MKKPILAALALCYALGAAAQTPDTAAPEGYSFTDVKILPVTPVKDQSRSGTCWCYSTLSFFESEILRAGGPELDLSEMWIVRNIYFEKAVKYVRLHGSLNLAAVMIICLYFGSLIPAPKNALYKASLKVLAIPRHSPVDFISGPKEISAPRSFSNENTGILIAM